MHQASAAHTQERQCRVMLKELTGRKSLAEHCLAERKQNTVRDYEVLSTAHSAVLKVLLI